MLFILSLLLVSLDHPISILNFFIFFAAWPMPQRSQKEGADASPVCRDRLTDPWSRGDPSNRFRSQSSRIRAKPRNVHARPTLVGRPRSKQKPGKKFRWLPEKPFRPNPESCRIRNTVVAAARSFGVASSAKTSRERHRRTAAWCVEDRDVSPGRTTPHSTQLSSSWTTGAASPSDTSMTSW